MGLFSGIFAIPAEAADQYINEASHEELKVLIYVFRHAGGKIDGDKAAGDLSLTAAQLKKSLDFWAEKGLFSFSLSKGAQGAHAVNKKSTGKFVDVPLQYGEEEITRKAQSSAEIKFLLETVPERLGRLISPAECSVLLYLNEGAGLPADVILMIIEYCITSGKPNMRYIEKMAVGWADEGIDTHEKAENKIRELESRRSFAASVVDAFGIRNRALSQSEKQYISKWSGLKIPDELFKLAYDICVKRTGKLAFSYINSILTSWSEKGVKTLAQAENESRKGENGGRQKRPSYDIDEYVRLSMEKLHNE